MLDTASFYKPTEAGSYPIMLATYEIVCSKYPDAEVATAVKAFMHSALGNGQKRPEDNGYIPVPDAFKERLTSRRRHQRDRLVSRRRMAVTPDSTAWARR